MDIVTLATVPAVLALVNLAKGLGLAGKWSALVALLLGIVFSFTDYFFTVAQHDQAGIYGAIVAGAILGLSASGLHDVAGRISPSVGEVAEVPDEAEVYPQDDSVDEEVIDEPVEDSDIEEETKV